MKSFHQFSFCNLLLFSFLLLLLVGNIVNCISSEVAGDPSKQHHQANGGIHSDTINDNETKKPLPPIILIPGSMATKLYVTGTNSGKELEEACKDQTEQKYKKAWISLDLTNDAGQKCIFAQLTLGHKNGKTINKHKNLKVYTKSSRSEKFGSFKPTICLVFDESEQCQKNIDGNEAEANFGPLVSHLTKGLGYTKGKNLFAAPYDWRYEANNPQLNSYYNNLTQLIERETKKHGQRALLILHSLGNNVGNYYLNHHKKAMRKDWQEKHIAATINVAAPFGGTVEVMEEYISGNANRYLPSFGIENKMILPFARSLGSIATLLPNTLAFKDNHVLVSINGEKKTLAHMKELLEMADIGHFHEIYEQTIPKPQLHTKMYCIYGTGKETPSEYTYLEKVKGIFQLVPTETKNGDGDDTINVESLRVCDKWVEQWNKHHPDELGAVIVLDKVGHADIISNDDFYGLIEKVVEDIQKGKKTN